MSHHHRVRGSGRVREKALLKYRFSFAGRRMLRLLLFRTTTLQSRAQRPRLHRRSSGNVIRLDEEATDFPADFELAQSNEEVSWDYVKIGDASHLLPVAANFVILYSSGARTRIDVEYKNHRHFEASSNITFHSEASIPPTSKRIERATAQSSEYPCGELPNEKTKYCCGCCSGPASAGEAHLSRRCDGGPLFGLEGCSECASSELARWRNHAENADRLRRCAPARAALAEARGRFSALRPSRMARPFAFISSVGTNRLASAAGSGSGCSPRMVERCGRLRSPSPCAAARDPKLERVRIVVRGIAARHLANGSRSNPDCGSIHSSVSSQRRRWSPRAGHCPRPEQNTGEGCAV